MLGGNLTDIPSGVLRTGRTSERRKRQRCEAGMSAGTGIASQLQLEVSEDRLQAWVHVRGIEPGIGPLPTIDDVLKVLEQGKIVVNDAVRSGIQKLVAAVAQSAVGDSAAAPARFLVAEGQSPVEGEDGRFEWSAELAKLFAPPAEGERIDYFARAGFAIVEAGTVVGRVFPARNGTPGVDVLGAAHPPRKAWGAAIRLGPGVKLSPGAPDVVVAEVSGRVVEEHGQVRIHEVVEIAHDVDLSSGSVQATVDVNVHGSVRANFRVHTTKSLHVGKVIEAADVDAGGDITVRGGIFGQDHVGRVRAGGNVTTLLLSEVDIEAAGDIHFQKEILHSGVHALGSVIGERGTVIGGTTYAREGLAVGTLGSDVGLATPVAVGVEVEALRRIRQLEGQIKEATKTAEQIRQAINPVLADPKRLAPAQRERAMDLLTKADETDLKATEMRATVERLQKQAAPHGQPYVRVNELAHPGVQITVDAREVQVRNPLHGPVKIELRKVEGATEVVAVNQRTGSITVLPSVAVNVDAPPAAKRG
jgi:uncharacterized protein